jgi:hypothetical protein
MEASKNIQRFLKVENRIVSLQNKIRPYEIGVKVNFIKLSQLEQDLKKLNLQSFELYEKLTVNEKEYLLETFGYDIN